MLGTFVSSQAMTAGPWALQQNDNNRQELRNTFERDEAQFKDELTVYIKHLSLKQQTAIKTATLLNDKVLGADELKKLPLDLIEYLSPFQILEDLKPERVHFQSSSGLITTYKFLKKLYLLEEKFPQIFNNLSLLMQGLTIIDPTATFLLEITPSFIYFDQPHIDYIALITELLPSSQNTDERNEQATLESVSTLVEYCIKFNNLPLLIFLSLIRTIPFDIKPQEQNYFCNSIFDLACLSSKNNTEMIKFLIRESEKQQNDAEQNGRSEHEISRLDWVKKISPQAIVAGLVTEDAKKRRLLATMAQHLKIDFNQVIDRQFFTYVPICLSITRAQVSSFNFLLEQLNPTFIADAKTEEHPPVIKNILKEFTTVIYNAKPEKTSTNYISNILNMLDSFRAFLDKHFPELAENKRMQLKLMKKTIKDTFGKKLQENDDV